MNAITKEIIGALILDREYWEHSRKDGWKLRLSQLQRSYGDTREAMFMDRVYFPRVRRLTERMRKLSWFKDWEWEELELGYVFVNKTYWPADQDHAEWLSEHMQVMTELEYNYGEWAWEHLSEDMIFAEFPKPSFVQEQLMLFS